MKSRMSVYFLIVTSGVIVLLSFFQFGFGDFDWPFFLIMMTYSMVSTVLEVFIIKAIVEHHPRVIEARLSVNSTFGRFEKEGAWERYKELYKKEHVVSCFYKAYVCYAYIRNEFGRRRKKTNLSESDFKEAFLKKELPVFLKNEKISPFRKRKILKFQQEQDDASHIDRCRIKYLRGVYLGKGPSHYLGLLISIVSQFVSFALTIISMFHFSVAFDSVLIVKLSLIIVFTIADVYFVVSSAKAEIVYWEDWASAITQIEGIVLDGKTSHFENSLAAYHFQYTPDDKEKDL